MYHMMGPTNLPEEVHWGYTFRHAAMIRYNWAKYRTAPTYAMLKSIRDQFESKIDGSTFVATSNADGMFGQEGFPLDSVYTMQGDYGFLQCLTPCRKDSVFDTKAFVDRGLPHVNPETYAVENEDTIPRCPNCGGEMFMCVRAGSWFLDSWFKTQRQAYKKWLSSVLDKVRTENKKLTILEIGVGFNTPGVLRLPDERLAVMDGVSLVRVNEAHPDIPFDSNGVGAAVGANEALAFISQELGTP
uniref:Deacetylase sirtuin-type domain-containing protein n=1 Tax=Globisporangium ultimum (strain ATCC 200006 / CBS 805.95 / DAOM BR144) TaxID=431595 RepID=K3XCU2_GLOUD